MTTSDQISGEDNNHFLEMANFACQHPGAMLACPTCHHQSSVLAQWHLTNLATHGACVQMKCDQCDFVKDVALTLTEDAMPCWPLERITAMTEAIEQESKAFAEKIQMHVQAMPAAQFATHPLWSEAGWSATTYQWHPTSAAPPVMGLVFDNEEAGLKIFRDAERQMNHEDRFEEIRISVIQGDIRGQEQCPGYSIHLCADPDALCGHATMAEFVVDPMVLPFLGQWNHHYPIPGSPPMLPRFQQEFEQHQEFLLAPTVIRENGQRYVMYELGIVKNIIQFRELSEITDANDVDSIAHLLPSFIVSPH